MSNKQLEKMFGIEGKFNGFFGSMRGSKKEGKLIYAQLLVDDKTCQEIKSFIGEDGINDISDKIVSMLSDVSNFAWESTEDFKETCLNKLRSREINCLERIGVNSWKKMNDLTKKRILREPGFGRTTLKRINKFYLDYVGRELKD